MRRHFSFVHPHDLVALPGEGYYSRCGRCRMQVNPTAMGSQGTKSRKGMHANKLQRKSVSNSALVMDAKFYAYGEELEKVEVFKYLGRLVTFDDDDTQVVRGNLKKARRV